MDNILTVKNISKKFPPNITALENASFEIRKGEVHCLLGANGAGKSTLLKIIAGAQPPSTGEIYFDGKLINVNSPSEAEKLGISMIYQELDLVPQLTVEENLYLGHAPSKFGVIDKKKRSENALEILNRIHANFSTKTKIEDLSIANQQLTAIARSLTMDAKIVIMDEPSASLNETELKKVFEVIRKLTAQGVAIVYVSHRLGELREIGDRVTVLRNGRSIETFDIATTTEETLVTAIIGEKNAPITRSDRIDVEGEVALKVTTLKNGDGLDIKDFSIKWGEITGLAGLNGSGRTSFLNSLFGVIPFEGSVTIDDVDFCPKNPAEAIKLGLGFVPKDRKTKGLIINSAIYTNVMLPSLNEKWLTKKSWQLGKAIPALEKLSAKYGAPEQAVIQLSGGNQQKVVLAKWIVNGSRILLLDEPSRGLDIGAKADLYKLVYKLAENGDAIIISSSELDEIYSVCDSIWVFHEGQLAARYNPSTTDCDTILKSIILGSENVS